MNHAMHLKWRELLKFAGSASPPVDESFEQICHLYASPGRSYHTLDHIRNVLETVESLCSQATNWNAVCLAAWLHDVIYDSKATDNEERSAEVAQRMCAKLAIPDGDLVAAHILTTKTHDAAGNPDAQVLIDADLAVLGASESVYRSYATNIRQEYSWVAEADYRAGRKRVLERFLAKPRVFHFLNELEASARTNMAGEIAELTD